MEKILFADDDTSIQEITKTILTKEGYAVVVATDGKEALELAKQEKPDLALLDFSMPFMDGIEVCKELRKGAETRDIPIIMVTAYPNEKEAALSAGAIDFLSKPVDKIDLLLRIKSALQVRKVNNELQRMISYIAELEKKFK
jgi:CheY-like chemotaxis protein